MKTTKQTRLLSAVVGALLVFPIMNAAQASADDTTDTGVTVRDVHPIDQTATGARDDSTTDNAAAVEPRRLDQAANSDNTTGNPAQDMAPQPTGQSLTPGPVVSRGHDRPARAARNRAPQRYCEITLSPGWGTPLSTCP